MTETVTITTFRNNIGTFIDRLMYKNESILITKGNKVVAQVVAPPEATTSSKTKRSPLLKLAGIWSSAEAAEFEKILKAMDEASKKDVLKHF